MSVQLKFELPSDPELLCAVRGAVMQLGTLGGFSEEDCRGVTLAVDEALTNIIRHAYDGKHDQPIWIECCREDDRLEFRLIDRGRAVRPEQLKGRPLDDVRPGGLGIHLIQGIMDEVEYTRVGDRNSLRLVKYLAAETR
jgi:anti-sigma regulatory factor (Ser/Thr protein kinase)